MPLSVQRLFNFTKLHILTRAEQYRDLLEVGFRDQTEHVVHRANRKAHDESEPSSRAQVKAHTSRVISAFPDDSGLDLFKSIRCGIQPRLDILPMEVATSLFFRTFVDRLDGTSLDGLEDLPDLYTSTSAQSTLSKAIGALGMTVLYKRHKNVRYFHNALKEYFRTINEVNTILCDPREARSDQVLMTVMLLALFEMYTCAAPQCFRAWQAHLNGARILVQLRGPQQFRSRAGVNMFRRLRTYIVSHDFTLVYRPRN